MDKPGNCVLCPDTARLSQDLVAFFAESLHETILRVRAVEVENGVGYREARGVDCNHVNHEQAVRDTRSVKLVWVLRVVAGLYDPLQRVVLSSV